MILRSPSSPSPLSPEAISAWKAIQRTQQQAFPEGVDLVTQPSHAALAGEIAAKLKPEVSGPLTPEIVRAISLHDSGWGAPDAQQIMQLRGTAGKPGSAKPKPVSFVAASPQESVHAWTASIETVAKTSDLGAYLVSSHFTRLAEGLGNAQHAKFIDLEKQRRQRLLKKIERTPAELGRLVETLQFCDELSLYLCCGAMENVRFSQHGGITLRREDENCVFEPSIFAEPQEFKFAALRVSSSKEKKDSGGREIAVKLR